MLRYHVIGLKLGGTDGDLDANTRRIWEKCCGNGCRALTNRFKIVGWRIEINDDLESWGMSRFLKCLLSSFFVHICKKGVDKSVVSLGSFKVTGVSCGVQVYEFNFVSVGYEKRCRTMSKMY